MQRRRLGPLNLSSQIKLFLMAVDYLRSHDGKQTVGSHV